MLVWKTIYPPADQPCLARPRAGAASGQNTMMGAIGSQMLQKSCWTEQRRGGLPGVPGLEQGRQTASGGSPLIANPVVT